MIVIPTELMRVKNYLNENNNQFSLSAGNDDPRQDSAHSEFKIVTFLLNSPLRDEVKFVSPNLAKKTNREWYDIRVNSYYCDIKISNCQGNDNTNAKHAIYYFLTGKTGASPHQKPFFKSLKENTVSDKNRNFFYIIINKNNKETNIVSLKNISGLKPNPKNQPFQCNWSEAIKNPKDRNWEEAKTYLLGIWAKSILRDMENTKAGMPACYPEFFAFRDFC